jgi:farnesyl diphosphate synthase
VSQAIRQDAADIKDTMAEVAAAVDRVLDGLLPVPPGVEGRVVEAMRYATLASGKRLRPFLVVSSARLFDVPDAYALRTGAAVELIHSYSLVHDDLPAMDDSDLRRGQPTVHRKFDEATAVLAGDGLLTLAFEVLVDPATHPDAEVRCRLATALGRGAGTDGMVGGQMIDLAAETMTLDLDGITRLQHLKTGALIRFSCVAGAILAATGEAERAALEAYARDLGLAFQIVDDLLDAEGDAQALGKPTGQDEAAGKATFVSLLGTAGARAKARDLHASAVSHLDIFGKKADVLRYAAQFVIERRS